MAVPKRKTSKSKRDSRKSSNWKAEAKGLSTCPQCHSPKLPHHACPTCGAYKDRHAIDVD